MPDSELHTTGRPEVLDAILQDRRSCRAFRPEPVPAHIVERILEMAQKSPSWCNTQPWHATITSKNATERFRRGLVQHVRSGPHQPDFPFPHAYEGEYRARRRHCAAQLYGALGIEPGDRVASVGQAMKNFEFFGAPHVAVITTEDALGVYGAVDCGLYVGTFLLAAESLGVACIPQAALAGYAEFIREFLGLDNNRKIVCAISFGYADEDHPANGFQTTREPVANAASWAH
ncbi:nitroreductase [Rhodococcus sp. EPR-134]|uniref:nitroreductase n=1 Tax=Rhodococcus sp. EPR-134 TaxID=1813675 RepID=UPI0007BB1789|nr:nitroreductase [Rhodococcus sp. EPR-134]KZF14537.1 nitroreductase [Rhodococcus sp. EPR-134]